MSGFSNLNVLITLSSNAKNLLSNTLFGKDCNALYNAFLYSISILWDTLDTNANHLKPESQNADYRATTFFRDGHMARNDGNSVDLDVETTEMSKNSVMFNALIQANKKSSGIYKSVIEASQKVN